MRIELYTYKNSWKILLLIVAVLIAIGTLWYTETFLKQLRSEEQKRAQIWAEAVKIIANSADQQELSLALQVVEKNTTIPIIMTDMDTNIVTYRNVEIPSRNEEVFLAKLLAEMIATQEPIAVQLGEGNVQYMFFRDSYILTKLRLYPIILLGVIALFIGIAYMAFSNVRRSEQNRVWTGMAKETAHQIGTPLSSLMGWIEILRGYKTDESVLGEMEKDINRLQTITDRFSKIGSQPQLKPRPIVATTQEAVAYLSKRSSNRITIDFENHLPNDPEIPLNKQLYGWVIENLVRNAIDAISGKGNIKVEISDGGSHIVIDVSDTGKGMSPNQTKTIFRPGYTTKSRGWGLGLSLAKRIINEYHRGRIWVLKSAPGKGTTFRIQLPKTA